MDSRLSRLIALSLVTGCAAAGSEAEPREHELLAGSGSIMAELIVDVVDQGRPVIADGVAAWSDGTVIAEGHCIVHANHDRCKVWSLRFDATKDVTLSADLCEQRHFEPFALTLDPDPDSYSLLMSLALSADGLACPEALPHGCGPDGLDEPAFSVSVMDADGTPAEVSDVLVRYNDEQPIQADCIEGVGGGCSEWVSPRTEPGRYQASVRACGKTFASSWVEVAADAFGCAAEPRNVTVAVDMSCGS